MKRIMLTILGAAVSGAVFIYHLSLGTPIEQLNGGVYERSLSPVNPVRESAEDSDAQSKKVARPLERIIAISRNQDRYWRMMSWYKLVHELPQTALSTTLTEIELSLPTPHYHQVSALLLRRIASHDLASAVSHVLRMDALVIGKHLQEIFADAAERHLEAAIESLDTLPERWREAASLGILESIDNAQDRVELAHQIGVQPPLVGHSAADARLIWESLIERHDGLSRKAALQDTAMRIAKDDPQFALLLNEQLPMGETRSQIAREVLGIWADQNGPEAVQWVLDNRTRDPSSRLLGRVFYRYAQREPERALAAAEAISDIERREVAIRNVVRTWAMNHPNEAVSRYWQSEFRFVADRALQGAMTALVDDQIGVAEELLNKVDVEAAREVAQQLGYVLRLRSPQEVAQRLQAIESPKLQNVVAGRVVRQWGMSDPEGTGRWLATLPAELAMASYGNLMWDWVRRDVERAVAYASGIRDEAGRDHALWLLATNVKDTAILRQVYDTIRDDSKKRMVGKKAGLL